MYKNECIFDRFDISFSSNSHYVSTGSYNDTFIILDLNKNTNSTITANVEQKKFSNNEIVREYEITGRNFYPEIKTDENQLDFSKKILHTCWHPKEDCLAVSNDNCIFLVSK